MALQQRMGILSKRRAGFGLCYTPCPGFVGQVVGRLSPTARNTRWGWAECSYGESRAGRGSTDRFRISALSATLPKPRARASPPEPAP